MNDKLQQQLLLPSPLENVKFQYRGDSVELYVKRDDLIHFIIGGNKWRKLMGHPVFKQPKSGVSIVGTGGNYSNLVFAICWMCKLYGYPLTILSPETDRETYLMNWAKSFDVEFIGLSRTRLRGIRNGTINPLEFLPHRKELIWIPEGGSGLWSEEGIWRLIDELKEQLQSENAVILSAAGTGITGFYMAAKLPLNWQLMIFPAVRSKKFNDWLASELKKHHSTGIYPELISQDGDMGIGNVSDELLDFLVEFYDQSGILLDPFYNGKALFYFWKSAGFQSLNKDVVLIHSGGTQAWHGLGLKYPSDKRIQYLANVFNQQFRRASNFVF